MNAKNCAAIQPTKIESKETKLIHLAHGPPLLVFFAVIGPDRSTSPAPAPLTHTVCSSRAPRAKVVSISAALIVSSADPPGFRIASAIDSKVILPSIRPRPEPLFCEGGPSELEEADLSSRAKKARIGDQASSNRRRCRGGCPSVWTIESYCPECHG